MRLPKLRHTHTCSKTNIAILKAAKQTAPEESLLNIQNIQFSYLRLSVAIFRIVSNQQVDNISGFIGSSMDSKFLMSEAKSNWLFTMGQRSVPVPLAWFLKALLFFSFVVAIIFLCFDSRYVC